MLHVQFEMGVKPTEVEIMGNQVQPMGTKAKLAEEAEKTAETKAVENSDIDDLMDEVKEEEAVKVELEPVEIQPVEDFKTKDSMEAYGKGFGIDLNKSKTIANMYADLVAHVDKI